MVTSFKYLGRVILATDNDWPVVVRNLSQAKKVWSRMSRILNREGEAPRVSGLFSKAIIQAVLLFGAETWVVTLCMDEALGGFHNQVTRRLTGQILRRTTDGKWIHTSEVAAREEACFLTKEE